VNFYNNNGEITFAENQIITLENQPGLCYIDALDVSNNYWGGGAPENLAEGITCGTYYTEVTEEGTLSGMLCAVTFDCSSISVSETDGYVSSEEDYTVTLSVNDDTCAAATVKVWVGDVQLEIGTHYTYENTTGKLTVLKEYLTASVKIVEGEATGHNFADATCTTPKTCKVCQATEGDVLPHAYNDATCHEPKTCPDCGATEGDVKAHVDADTDYKCDDCGENLPMTGTPAIIWTVVIGAISAGVVLLLIRATKKKRY
ncbi:MAG: hypothetical protein IJF64_03410, partial [Clostridia bacterium]|nr:hypothetical protein [Clostridia bacterium]